jgi:hypothetical protein
LWKQDKKDKPRAKKGGTLKRQKIKTTKQKPEETVDAYLRRLR